MCSILLKCSEPKFALYITELSHFEEKIAINVSEKKCSALQWNEVMCTLQCSVLCCTTQNIVEYAEADSSKLQCTANNSRV